MVILSGYFSTGNGACMTTGGDTTAGACDCAMTGIEGAFWTLFTCQPPSTTEQPAGVSMRLMTSCPFFDFAALLSFIMPQTLAYNKRINQNYSNYFELHRIIAIMEEKSDKDRKIIDYDAIFIGQLGTIVANIVVNYGLTPYKFLIINGCKEVIEPALLPVLSPIVQIKRDYLKNFDVESERILKLYPQSNLISMQKKKWYRYRYLVYTSGVEEWSDFAMIENLNQALMTKYSFVYSNVIKNDPKLSSAKTIFKRFQSQKMKRLSVVSCQNKKIKDNGSQFLSQGSKRVIYSESQMNFIFYIPNSHHSGYDNLNILYKYDEFMEYFTKLRRKNGQDSQIIDHNDNQSLNFILLVQGSNIYPHCMAIDALIKEKIEEKGIKVLKNHKIQKIDYLRRKISVLHSEQQQEGVGKQVSICFSNTINFSFDYLHIVIKQKVPHLLASSGIKPYQNCPKTLLNQQYKNIFIYGADIFPTTHSFQAMNHQAHIISLNLLKLLKANRTIDSNISTELSEYTGHSAIKLWINQQISIKLDHQYEDSKAVKDQKQRHRKIVARRKIYDSQRAGCCFSFFCNAKDKYLFGIEVSLYYNFKSYGAPFYLFLPQKTNFKGI